VIFVCMVANSALLLMMRSLSVAMLMLVQTRYFLIYIAGDMALYLLQKVLRGDFHYWLPIDGAVGLVLSLLARVIVKTIADFTGVIQFRHPGELGGLYWTVNMFMALVASFASLFVYFDSGGEAVAERTAWTLVGCMGGAWLITFGVFFLVMKKDYRRTFFSTMSGKRNSMNYFLMGADDQVKSEVLTINKHQWRQIRGEVKEWVLANWYRWVTAKPAWFTEAWVFKLPEDFIPDDEDQARLEEIRQRGRRRSSAGTALNAAIIQRLRTKRITRAELGGTTGATMSSVGATMSSTGATLDPVRVYPII